MRQDSAKRMVYRVRIAFMFTAGSDAALGFGMVAIRTARGGRGGYVATRVGLLIVIQPFTHANIVE